MVLICSTVIDSSSSSCCWSVWLDSCDCDCCGLIIKIIRTTDSKITNARLPSRTILCFFICVPSFPLFCHQAFFLLSQR